MLVVVVVVVVVAAAGGGGGGGVVKIESSHKKLRDVERISARLLARKVWAYFT